MFFISFKKSVTFTLHFIYLWLCMIQKRLMLVFINSKQQLTSAFCVVKLVLFSVMQLFCRYCIVESLNLLLTNIFELLSNLIRWEVQYLHLGILSNSPDFLLLLRYLDNEMLTCLICWNVCLVFRFVFLYIFHKLNYICSFVVW